MAITTTAIILTDSIMIDKDYWNIQVRLVCNSNGKEVINETFTTSYRTGENMDYQLSLLQKPMQKLINEIQSKEDFGKKPEINTGIEKLKTSLTKAIKEGVSIGK